MKKKILLTLGILFLLNGCVKTTTTQTINKDKSVNFETIVLISNKFNYKEELAKINQTELTKDKYIISEVDEDRYKGIKISKQYKNIDAISSEKGNEVILSDLLKGKMDDTIMFKVNKSFFKNEYTANMKYKLRSEIYNYESKNPIESSNEIISLQGEMKYKYIVKLPYEALSNNANIVSKDGKTLTWTLTANDDSEINYSFTLLNLKNIYIVAGIGLIILLAIIILVIVLISKMRKRHKDDEPIHIDYDPSIEEDLKDAPEVATEITNNEINGNAYEYMLPEEEKAKEEIKIAAVEKKVEEKKNKFITETEEVENLDFDTVETTKKLDTPEIEKL